MKKYLIILKKELKDCFRDRRSIVMMILPLLMFPLLLTLTNQQMKTADDMMTTGFSIASNTEIEISDLTASLKMAEYVRLERFYVLSGKPIKTSQTLPCNNNSVNIYTIL